MSNPSLDFYWRPGCGFCMMLKRNLNKLGIPLNEINIWEAPGASEFVRSVANGNETVPTVHIDGMSLVNPSTNEVLQLLETHGPELVPEGVEAEEPKIGRVGRFVVKALGGEAS